MSSQGDQRSIWTPPVIATIVYRVVMIIVSIAFLWKKYRRPARHLDEEQLVGVLLPNYNVPTRRARSANKAALRSRARSGASPTLREVILAHLEDMVQSAVGLDKEDGSINRRSISFDNLSINGSSLDASVGLDIDLGDIGLRHRSADHLQPSKHNENKYSHKEEL